MPRTLLTFEDLFADQHARVWRTVAAAFVGDPKSVDLDLRHDQTSFVGRPRRAAFARSC